MYRQMCFIKASTVQSEAERAFAGSPGAMVTQDRMALWLALHGARMARGRHSGGADTSAGALGPPLPSWLRLGGSPEPGGGGLAVLADPVACRDTKCSFLGWLPHRVSRQKTHLVDTVRRLLRAHRLALALPQSNWLSRSRTRPATLPLGYACA